MCRNPELPKDARDGKIDYDQVHVNDAVPGLECIYKELPKKRKKDTRFYLKNIQGLQPQENYAKLENTCRIFKTKETSAWGMPEAHLNWAIPNVKRTVKKIIGRFFTHNKTVVSDSAMQAKAKHKPGGTIQAMCNNIRGNVVDSGCDNVKGRWTYHILEGKKKKLCVLTACKTPQKNSKHAGPMTAVNQQAVVDKLVYEEVDILDQHREFDNDLDEQLQDWKNKGYEMMVMMDAKGDSSKCPWIRTNSG